MKELLLLSFLLLLSCQPSLDQQPRLSAYQRETFFANESADRDPLPDTYAYGQGQTQRPRPTMKLLKRGQERFEIFCTVCHGKVGDGLGIVTQHGLRPPPNFHTDSARKLTDTKIYEIISHGQGRMTRLGDRIDPADRWAIVAYLRALQLSQFSELKTLSKKEQKDLGP
jgi:hypothetical protein